ncbi:MAG: redoxin domain-containing protein [Gemmatimonadales bacterium]|nr:MAG: redoxin domain-containing protein [Gemmatimonadales bacterium]
MEAYRDQYAELFRGGREIVLLAVSTDSPEEQQSWAEDADFPFLFASDPGGKIGRRYGAFRSSGNGIIDNRTVFVIDPEGVIRWVAAPFREIDPVAYEELGGAIKKYALSPQDDSDGD